MSEKPALSAAGDRARDLLKLFSMGFHPRPVVARDQPERARFEALRRRIFEEMSHETARWRLTWFLFFNAAVLTLLVVRGESGPRLIIQGFVLCGLGVVFALRVWWDNTRLKIASFLAGVVSYFTVLSTTGGLASPLMMTCAVTIAAAAISLRDTPWLRSLVFAAFFACFVALAALSRTTLGRLPEPLVGAAGWASPEYVALALLSGVYTMMGVFRIGCHVTRGYERAAFELAARREELCSENEDRSRQLECVAARLAHEVKNPLAAIKGLSTHMARNATDPKTAERLGIVAAEADRLQSIVDGFLSFSRGLDDLKIGPTKPHDVAHSLAVLLETRAQDAGVSLQVDGDEELVVDADVRQLRQALLNLVLNAVQASPRGATVDIAVARDCGGARITVRDQGVGMSRDVIERIRKPYFTTKEGGTGLGVAVARGIIQQHGGRLEFTSAPGRGTTATVHLPMKACGCAALPNPLRAALKGDAAEQPREGQEPAVANVLST
jgi:signal transduction histidine kinase